MASNPSHTTRPSLPQESTPTKATHQPARSTPNKKRSTSRLSIQTILFVITTVVALIFGWHYREFSYITAESGIGYSLGIIGGVSMLVLLLYPIRKKARFARGWGPVKYWFRGHMTLGVLGPLLILYHANFSLGSMNSNVALFSMILVATSGLIGRYIYTKIHFGLYGERASLDALVARQSNAQENLNRQFSYAPSIQHQIEKFTSQTLLTPSSFLGSIWRCAAISCATRYHYFHLNREMINEIKNYGRLNKWDKKKIRMHYKQDQAELALFFRSIRKVTGFNVYEKLFSLWHVLHLPLFISMVLTGFVHVYAVHFY